MSQPRLTASPEKTKQRIERRASCPASARSFQGGLHPILQLQRTIGNRAVGRLIQAKLAVSHPGDPYEREADRVAEQVTSMPSPESTPTAQRQMMPDEEKDKQPLQTKPLAASMTPLAQRQVMPEEEKKEAPPVQKKPLAESITPIAQRQMIPEEEKTEEKPVQPKLLLQRSAGEESVDTGHGIEQQLGQCSGTGSSLPESVRSYMEPRFRTDFSGVYVHTGSESQHLHRSLNAQAFTVGQDIYYGASKSPTDLSLTTHELTHVVQQDGEQLQRARTQAKEGAATGGDPSGREKEPLNFLSTARHCSSCSGLPRSGPVLGAEVSIVTDAPKPQPQLVMGTGEEAKVMTATQSRKTKAAGRRQPTEKVAGSPDHAHQSSAERGGLPQPTAMSLVASALSERANMGMRAQAMARLLRFHGNRAVQRYIQRISGATTAPMLEDNLARSIETRAGAGRALEQGATSRLEGVLGADLPGVPSLYIQRDGNKSQPKSKKPSYRPKVTRSPDKQVRGLNEWVEVNARVTNAGSAPQGTEFNWDWDWDAEDSKVLIPDNVRPKSGPKAKLRAKAKAVGTTAVDPIVDYSLPSDVGGPLPRFKYSAPVQVTVPPPKASFFTVLTHGGQSPTTPRREGRCFMGDELYVSATFSGINKPQYNGLDFGVRGSSPRFIQSVQWKGDKLTWNLKADKVGKSRLEFWVKVPGMIQELKHVEDMTTLFDLQRFHLAVTSAQSKASTKLGNAARKINAAAASYERAYDAQQDVLTHKAKEEQLRQELALGALFAVLGGAAGGAVGNLVKEALGKPLADAAKGGALIDLTKDLVKFSVRTLPKLGGQSGGGAQSGGPSETPGGGPEIAQKDENKAAGEKPSQMLYRFEAIVGADQAKVNTALSEVTDAALKLSSEANFKGEFDEDPREIVDRDVTVDQITAGMVESDQEYARKLWHAWLPGNVQKGLRRNDDPWPGMRYWSPRGWLEVAAAQCGEDVDSWIGAYWPQGLQVKGPGAGMSKL